MRGLPYMGEWSDTEGGLKNLAMVSIFFLAKDKMCDFFATKNGKTHHFQKIEQKLFFEGKIGNLHAFRKFLYMGAGVSLNTKSSGRG